LINFKRRTYMKKTLFVLLISLSLGEGWGGALLWAQHGSAEVAAPADAASVQTWTFGRSTLVWSDRIAVPACNKTGFTDSYTEPQCRSHTVNGQLLYYYNWTYVNANRSALCPPPWRVPAKDDFDALKNAADYTTLINAWGYGGYTSESGMSGTNMLSYYWSSTKYGSIGAYESYYYNGYLYVSTTYRYYGQSVRCVRD
jgi:hypothetical protein